MFSWTSLSEGKKKRKEHVRSVLQIASNLGAFRGRNISASEKSALIEQYNV
jgi:hypothetical protein